MQLTDRPIYTHINGECIFLANTNYIVANKGVSKRSHGKSHNSCTSRDKNIANIETMVFLTNATFETKIEEKQG